jgi:hypothetical protein
MACLWFAGRVGWWELHAAAGPIMLGHPHRSGGALEQPSANGISILLTCASGSTRIRPSPLCRAAPPPSRATLALLKRNVGQAVSSARPQAGFSDASYSDGS